MCRERVRCRPLAVNTSRKESEPALTTRIAERKFSIKQAAAAIGISPSGVRLLLNKQKLGYYQSGTRRIIGEGHLDAYLATIERNKAGAQLR
jgi:excisionase family DNA binding protein